jgi:hypothetical protein
LNPDPTHQNFEDVAIVGHNKTTGHACFFQTLSEHFEKAERFGATGIPATRVPPPSEAADVTPPGALKADEFWLTPQATASIGCYSCHDSDPFIHTPYIDQVRKKVGHQNLPLVPPGPNLSKNPPEPSRYKHVGLPFLQWPEPRRLDLPTNHCTSCHDIGEHRTCGTRVGEATGQPGERPADISDHGWKYPLSRWMPPNSIEMNEQTWKSQFQDDVDQVLACCGNPACNRKLFDD